MIKKITFLIAGICGIINAQYPQLKSICEEEPQKPSSLTLAYQQNKSISKPNKGTSSHLAVPVASRGGSPVPTINETTQPTTDNKWTHNVVIPFVIPVDPQEGNTISPANKNLPKKPILKPKPERTPSIIISTPSQSKSSPTYSIKIPKKKHLFLADICETKVKKESPKKTINPKIDEKAFFEKLEKLKREFTFLLIAPPQNILYEALHAEIPVDELIKKTFMLNYARITHAHKDILNKEHLIIDAENIWKEIYTNRAHNEQKGSKSCCSLQ